MKIISNQSEYYRYRGSFEEMQVCNAEMDTILFHAREIVCQREGFDYLDFKDQLLNRQLKTRNPDLAFILLDAENRFKRDE